MDWQDLLMFPQVKSEEQQEGCLPFSVNRPVILLIETDTALENTLRGAVLKTLSAKSRGVNRLRETEV